MSLKIKGPITTLNEYINAERSNKYKASSIKREETERVIIECRIQKIDLIEYPAHFLFVWGVSSSRKDPDNISFSCKFVFDGLVKAGVMWNDNSKYVLSIHHIFKNSAADFLDLYWFKTLGNTTRKMKTL